MDKYVIEIPYEVKWIQYIQQTGHGTINLKVESVSDLTPYTEPDRKAIENEVWEFAKKVRLEEFIDEEGRLHGYISGFNSYSEAKAKYEAWKKQKDEIHEYDEIISDLSCGKAVIIRIRNWGQWDCINIDGNFTIYSDKQKYWRKTGRSFPEFGDLLKKMGDESND